MSFCCGGWRQGTVFVLSSGQVMFNPVHLHPAGIRFSQVHWKDPMENSRLVQNSLTWPKEQTETAGLFPL